MAGPATRVVVHDEIVDEEGHINPEAPVDSYGEHNIPPGLQSVARPVLDPDRSEEYRKIFVEAKKLRRSGDTRHVNQIISDMMLEADAQRKEKAKKVMSRAPRPVSPPPPRPGLRQSLQQHSVSRVDPVLTAEDLLADDWHPAPSSSPPPQKMSLAQLRANRDAKKAQEAGRLAAEAARAPRLDELMQIEDLQSSPQQAENLATVLSPEGEGLEFVYNWMVADEQFVVLVVDARVDDQNVIPDVSGLSSFTNLTLKMQESTGDEEELSVISTIMSFQFGIFRFILFFLNE